MAPTEDSMPRYFLLSSKDTLNRLYISTIETEIINTEKNTTKNSAIILKLPLLLLAEKISSISFVTGCFSSML